jgi:hypothetical protein
MRVGVAAALLAGSLVLSGYADTQQGALFGSAEAPASDGYYGPPMATFRPRPT